VFPGAGTYNFELIVSEGERLPLCPLHLVENPDAR
jgi:hypothetical protein